MKIIGLVLATSIMLAPMAARARTWVGENIQDATCDVLPAGGVASPADYANQNSDESNTPEIKKVYGSDGQLTIVNIYTTEAGGTQVHASFFTSMAGCQAQLKADLASGRVVDPDSIN